MQKVCAEDAGSLWNLEELKKTPDMHWLSQTGAVHSLMVSGEKFKGHDTEVFAVYASPITLGEAKPGSTFPGVVLVHGGGGTAFADWVYLWAKRGYAAIAMDLGGHRPPDPEYNPDGSLIPGTGFDKKMRVRLPNSGPDQVSAYKFAAVGGDLSDDWPYHAAADVIRAHSLLRSFPEVDASRTAITGISWGGYTTCLAASLDDRFKAAVPVYGCGFLYEGESVQKHNIDELEERRDLWIRQYDPSSLLPQCRVPIFFLNGTNDKNYPLDSWQRSVDCVPGFKLERIEPMMKHSHPDGWAPMEIGLFIDAYCRGGDPLPVPEKIHLENGKVYLPFKSTVPVVSAALHYTQDDGPRVRRVWKMIPAEVQDSRVISAFPPEDATMWFISMTDKRGAMVTSPVQRPELK